MRLAGIELRNFRSIGDEAVELNPWARCNILVGQNNSGKSNVLKAIKLISDRFNMRGGQGQRSADLPGLTELDAHGRNLESEFKFRLHFECHDPDDEQLAGIAQTRSFWFDFAWKIGDPSQRWIDNSFAAVADPRQANKLLSHLVQRTWRDLPSPIQIRREFLNSGPGIFGTRFGSAVPPAHIIPEFRQIRQGDGEYQMDGMNLIELLTSYQHPEIGRDADQDKFERIQTFVRRLVHLPDAVLEVTAGDRQIVIKNGDLRLPVIGSYGTGVHELIILVTAALSIDDALCCIEEPEIHFHPRLQREFIEFLTKQTTNQYLISTHSPTFIDCMSTCDGVQVFHLRLENGATMGAAVSSEREGLEALHDLGVKASDILQSNCVLWVEGPSDRVYLKRWLELVSSELCEGRHYSIMFYGGSLRAHISAEREKAPDELVKLLRINQHAVVVLDSDRTKASDALSETVQRIQQECEGSDSICWITDGREIENYIPKEAVIASREELGAEAMQFSLQRYGRFENALKKALKDAGANPVNYARDKVKYARYFARHCQRGDLGADLRKRLKELEEAIHEWNT